MSFSRANPLGWALYEVLTSAQMNALDIDHANAIDGAAGGTYAPTSKIQFDGDVEWAGTRLPKLVSRDYKRVQPLVFMWGSNLNLYTGGGPGTVHLWDCGDWDARQGGATAASRYHFWRASYVDVTPTSDNPPEMWLECPVIIDKSTISAMGVWLNPMSGASLAEFPPSIALFRQNASGGSGPFGSMIHEHTDTTSPVGSYRTDHVAETAAAAFAEVVDMNVNYNRRFCVRIHGESGSGAQSNLEITGFFLTFTVTELVP